MVRRDLPSRCWLRAPKSPARYSPNPEACLKADFTETFRRYIPQSELDALRALAPPGAEDQVTKP
jgi:hypothetical protein